MEQNFYSWLQVVNTNKMYRIVNYSPSDKSAVNFTCCWLQINICSLFKILLFVLTICQGAITEGFYHYILSISCWAYWHVLEEDSQANHCLCVLNQCKWSNLMSNADKLLHLKSSDVVWTSTEVICNVIFFVYYVPKRVSCQTEQAGAKGQKTTLLIRPFFMGNASHY